MPRHKTPYTWDGRMDRAQRMRATWIDMIRRNQTKLPFAMFEERMLRNDIIQARQAFEKRKVSIKNGSLFDREIKKLLSETKKQETFKCQN